MWFACLLFVILFHVSLVGCVQFLQYYYQSGCLYRLRASGGKKPAGPDSGVSIVTDLNHGRNVDLDYVIGSHCICYMFGLKSEPRLTSHVTLTEGFQSWMWRGLHFSSRFYSLVMWVSAFKCCLSFFMQYTKCTDPKHLNSVCVYI